MTKTVRSYRGGVVSSALASAFVALSIPHPAAATPTPEPSSASSSVYGLLFEQAAMWRERNRLDLAAQSLRKILESQPDNTEALFQLGSIELQRQRFSEVRATIARLKQIDPNDSRAAELERAMAVGQTDDVALAEARRLAATGAYDRAIAAYQRAFHGGPPPFDLAVEYYETLAGTGAGWEEARLRLKALSDRSYATSRTKFAYARVLTYNEQTRREGIALLAELASDPAVGQAAFEAMRQGMLWLTLGPQDKPFYESYLKRFPGDTLIRDRLVDSQRPVRVDPLSTAITDAYRLLDQNLYDQAVARFESILQTDPNNADAIAGIGIVRLRQERFADARDQLTKALKIAPSRQADWGQALESATFWMSYREAVALRDRGDIAGAEKIARPLADQTASTNERGAAQALMGDLLRRQGKQREAEGYYRDALSRDPGNKDAQAGLYQVLTAQGRNTSNEPLLANLDPSARNRIQSEGAQEAAQRLRVQASGLERSQPDRAEQLYREAMRMDPSTPWIKYDLAKFLARTGHVAQAQPLIDELVASGRPESLYAAAVYYSEQQRSGEAMALLEQIPANQRSARMNTLRNDLRSAGDLDRLVAAAKAGDNSARAALAQRANAANATPGQQANIALALAKVGDRTQAMGIVRRLAARTNLDADTLRTLFYASMEAGADNEANALLARVSRSTGGHDTGNLQEALAIRQSDRLRADKNLGAAYDTLLPFVSVASPSIPARLALARVYQDSNYTEDALQILDGIMVSSPADADTLQQAVGIAIGLKRYERADVWMAEALRQQPQDPRLYLVQARLLRAEGDNVGALRALETAQQLNRGTRQSELVLPVETPVTRVAAIPVSAPAAVPASVLPKKRPGAKATQTQAAQVQPAPVRAAPPQPTPAQPAPVQSAQAEAVVPAEGDGMSEFERRVADLKGASVRSDRPQRSRSGQDEILSLDRRPTVAPDVQLADASTGSEPPPVQVAQSVLVPLRRPGGDSGSSGGSSGGYSGGTSGSGFGTPPGAPGNAGASAGLTPPPLMGAPASPSSSPQDNDPLSREISRELSSLKKDTAIVLEPGIGFRGRTGTSGFGALNEFTVPLKARFPIGNAALTPRVMPITLDAGAMANNTSTLSQFGANAAVSSANYQLPGSTRAAGVDFDLALDWGRLTADVGSTALGFPISNLVGGLIWNQPLGDAFNLKLEASRRAVTDSLLSYAGMTDPITGTTWGAVTRNGGEVVGSYDDTKNLGVYAKFAYGYYMGWNTASNQSYEFTSGAYFRPYKDETSELKLGISGTYLSFNQNFNNYTLGQGGYFSPQTFYSLTFPIDWNESIGKFKYNAGGAIGIQSLQQDGSAFFPNNYQLQNAANILASASSTSGSTTSSVFPYYAATSNTGIAFAMRLGFEYAVTDRTSIGGKATFDNAYQYDQGTILLFLRAAIN